MTLHIDSGFTLSELQSWFHKLFPGLKLEFFFNGTEGLNLSANLGQSFLHTRIRDLCLGRKQEAVDLPDKTTLKEFEHVLHDKFGLPARVYVQKDGYWLKSKTYDLLQLSHQERQEVFA